MTTSTSTSFHRLDCFNASMSCRHVQLLMSLSSSEYPQRVLASNCSAHLRRLPPSSICSRTRLTQCSRVTLAASSCRSHFMRVRAALSVPTTHLYLAKAAKSPLPKLTQQCQRDLLWRVPLLAPQCEPWWFKFSCECRVTVSSAQFSGTRATVLSRDVSE